MWYDHLRVRDDACMENLDIYAPYYRILIYNAVPSGKYTVKAYLVK